MRYFYYFFYFFRRYLVLVTSLYSIITIHKANIILNTFFLMILIIYKENENLLYLNSFVYRYNYQIINLEHSCPFPFWGNYTSFYNFILLCSKLIICLSHRYSISLQNHFWSLTKKISIGVCSKVFSGMEVSC